MGASLFTYRFPSFAGHIPKDLEALRKLRTLELNDNQLTGEDYKHVCFISLAGLSLKKSIRKVKLAPSEPPFGRIPKANFMLLFSPAQSVFALLLSGSIPPALGNLAALELFCLQRNQLSGGSLGAVHLLHPTWVFPEYDSARKYFRSQGVMLCYSSRIPSLETCA